MGTDWKVQEYTSTNWKIPFQKYFSSQWYPENNLLQDRDRDKDYVVVIFIAVAGDKKVL